MFNKPCFMTGSSVYGEKYKTKDSDIDLVCFFTPTEYADFLEEVGRLDEAHDVRMADYDGFQPNQSPIKFGKLNIIPVFNSRQWKAWQEATRRARRMKPKTKLEAIWIFDQVFGEKNYEP